jgi:hypothetical protein
MYLELSECDLRIDVSSLSRALVPLERLSFVVSDAIAMSVAQTKIELRIRMSRLSSTHVPLDRLSFVDSDARAILVTNTKIALRIRISRLSFSFERCEFHVQVIRDSQFKLAIASAAILHLCCFHSRFWHACPQ